MARTKDQRKRKTQTKAFVRTLVQMLEAADFDEAQRATKALGEIADPAAMRPLVEVFKRSSALRASALAALKKISKRNDVAATELAIALLREKRELDVAEVPAETEAQVDRRRMPRVLMEVPVMVKWVAQDGQPHTEPSTTQVVNAYGALVRLKNPLDMGRELEITNLKTQVTAKARVVWVGSRSRGGGVGIGVELGHPVPDFWAGYRTEEET
jgi:ribosomal protein S20